MNETSFFFISWDGIACYDYILHSIVNLHRRDEHENYDFWKFDHMNLWTSILNLVILQKIQYYLLAWLTSIQYPTNSICLEIQKLHFFFLSWNHRLLHTTSRHERIYDVPYIAQLVLNKAQLGNIVTFLVHIPIVNE